MLAENIDDASKVLQALGSLLRKHFSMHDAALAQCERACGPNGATIRQRDNQIVMNQRSRRGRNDQAAVCRTRKGCDVALDFAGVAHVERGIRPPHRARSWQPSAMWIV